MRALTATMSIMVLTLTVGGRTQASASPTPVPGGANQRAGVSGPITGELFNGKFRLRKMSLTSTTDSGDHYLVFSTLVANGTSKDRETLLEAHLADADGVTLDAKSGDPQEGPCDLEPGAACRQTFRFRIDDPQFKPVKVLVEEVENSPEPLFRVDLAAPASPG